MGNLFSKFLVVIFHLTHSKHARGTVRIFDKLYKNARCWLFHFYGNL